MTDKAFLFWIYNRLRFRYDENPQVDYMLRLKEIVDKLPTERARNPICFFCERNESKLLLFGEIHACMNCNLAIRGSVPDPHNYTEKLKNYLYKEREDYLPQECLSRM